MKRKTPIPSLAVCMALGCLLTPCQSALWAQCAGKSEAAPRAGSEKVVELPLQDSTVTINLGDAVRYSGSIHYSVGSDFWLEYDETAFETDCDVLYDNPESIARGECGGDRAQKTYTLRSLRKGEFPVKAVEDFRGECEGVVNFVIVVE